MSSAAVLELQDVVKHYRLSEETVRAVDGVSLSVAAGEIVALYGPSGSGKSTLLEIAAALVAPDAGEVRVNGRDVSRLSPRESDAYRLRELGLISQNFALISGASALFNASLKLKAMGVKRRDANRRVAELLNQVGLGGRVKHRPEELSMGERQRVAIVRALVSNPSVVLADEPTGSLDSGRTHEILTVLREMTTQRQIATLLVTHDGEAAAYADRVATMRDGRLEGAPRPVPAEAAR